MHELHQEAAILEELQSSPYVCRLIGRGAEDNCAYIVMELLDSSLATHFEACKSKFSMKTTLKLGMALVRALQSIHDLGYVHGDIKPVRKLLLRFWYCVYEQ